MLDRKQAVHNLESVYVDMPKKMAPYIENFSI
jgi:hypothetical protein